MIDDVFVVPAEDGGLLPPDTTLCSGQFPLSVEVQGNPARFVWWDGDTTARTRQITQPGRYAIRTAWEGCEIYDTIEVKMAHNPGPLLQLPDLSVCPQNLPQVITLSDTLPFYNYRWSSGTGGRSVSLADAGVYSVTADHPCGSVSDTFALRLLPQVEVHLPPDTTLCREGVEQPFMLRPHGPALPNYYWSTGAVAPGIVVRETGTYWLRSEGACNTDTDSVTLRGCPARAYIPDVFAPDAARPENAFFLPVILNGVFLELAVYDRWGSLVYMETAGSGGEVRGWDGFSRRQPCPAGVYAYYLRWRENDTGTAHSAKGLLTLVR